MKKISTAVARQAKNFGVYFVKTSRTSKSFPPVPRQNFVHSHNEWLRDEFDGACFDKILAMISAMIMSLRHLLGWFGSAFRSGGSRPRKPRSPSAIACSAHQTASPSTDHHAQAVLDRVENVLVGMDEASRLGQS
jgi:hypothetical protein